ncbi:MAG: alpha/beta fold hydrolase, partial [Gammaproteobacteria bacterium]
VPAACGMLDVGNRHSIHWRSFGHVGAAPVIAIHGGPGSGLNPQHLSFFNPLQHRVIMFDQRGTGLSTPGGATLANTTQHLVSDIEKLRNFLRVEPWLVFGVSWGACLSLLYGQSYPQASTSLVLVGLPNRHDYQNSWILEQRARLLPKRHQEFMAPLTPAERRNPVAAYYRKILSSRRSSQLEATYAVWVLEAGLTEPEPRMPTPMPLHEIDKDMINRAKLYLHYWINKTFLPAGHLLTNPSALAQVFTTFVHGEADWICPLSGVEQVAHKIEAAKLITVPNAGHSPFNADMMHTIREVIMANAPSR